MIFTNRAMDPNSPLARAINAAASGAAREQVRRAIVAARGNVDDAARLLGVSSPLVRRYIEKLGLDGVLRRAREANPGAWDGRGRPPGRASGKPSQTPRKE